LRFWCKWDGFFFSSAIRRQIGYERSEFPFCFSRRGWRRNGTRSEARGAMQPLAAALGDDLLVPNFSPRFKVWPDISKFGLMKNVWFIRHAESEANAGLPTSEPDLIALTPKGHEQAEVLAGTIDIVPELVVCSSYLRTQQTARPLLEKYPHVQTLVWPIHEFDFLSPKACINTTVDERRPWVRNYWDACQPDYLHGEGAESFNTFRNRVISCIKRLEVRDETFILVFAHGHVMRVIWQYFTTGGYDDHAAMTVFRDQMSLLPVNNTAIFKASYYGDAWKIVDPVFDPNVSKAYANG
jgi:broad specificity phosphatase PhoE